jgi:hypothetical protein
MAEDEDGSSSTGVTDGQYLITGGGTVFYAGGDSYNGADCGVFARDADDSASNADWGQRGRCALNR